MKQETYEDVLQDRTTGLDLLDMAISELQLAISRLHSYGWSEEEVTEKARRYYKLTAHYEDLINKVPNYPDCNLPDAGIFNVVEFAQAAAFRAEDAVDPAIHRTVRQELEKCWWLKPKQGP